MLKDNIVSKANDLNLRAYQLNKTEQLLVLSVASMIQPQDEDFKTYQLSIKDFMDLLDVKDQSKYIELPKLTKGLMSKVIEIKKTHSLLQVCWFSSVEHKLGEGIIEIEFSPKLKPYLLNLKDNFVSYALNQVARLSSKYSIRIYELLKQYQFKKAVAFELNDFRYLIGLDDTIYPRYSNMKPKILLSAQKELKEKTDISFEFEEIKTGRKVTSLKFYIHSNKVKPKALDEVSATLEASKEMNIEIGTREVLKILGAYKIDLRDACEIFNNADGDINYIEKVYEYSKTQNVKNLIGFMKDMVKPGKLKENLKFSKPSSFTDYSQRNYDFVDLEKKLLGYGDLTDDEKEVLGSDDQIGQVKFNV